jgi:hypothetical protein
MKKTILISGKAGSGKDTFARFLEEYLNESGYITEIIKISDEMKKRSEQDFSELSDYINKIADEISNSINVMADNSMNPQLTSYYKSLNLIIDKLRIKQSNWYENKTDLTRILLQTYGTEIFQNRVDINYWDSILMDKINNGNKNIYIVTDIRFPSNIYALSIPLKTITIRINRDNIKKINHISENALDDYKEWDYIVENNDTIENLKESAKTISIDIDKY